MREDSDELRLQRAQQIGMWRARSLDLRSYICVLFLIFGTIVTIAGFTASPADLDKAAGININLWAGLAMLFLGVVFGIWALAVPPEIPEPTDDVE